MTIDWSRPIEAVHEDGRVVPAGEPVENSYGRSVKFVVPERSKERHLVTDTGGVWGSDWRIRNVPEHPTPTQYAPELVKMTEAEVRDMLAYDADTIVQTMREWGFVSDLPQDVDPDEKQIDRIMGDLQCAGYMFANPQQAREAAKFALARGRQLQRGEAA